MMSLSNIVIVLSALTSLTAGAVLPGTNLDSTSPAALQLKNLCANASPETTSSGLNLESLCYLAGFPTNQIGTIIGCSV